MSRAFTLLFTLLITLMAISASAQAAGMVPTKGTSKFLRVKHKYCNDAKYHCLYVGSKATDISLYPKKASYSVTKVTSSINGITLFVLKDESHGQVSAKCDGKPSTVAFHFGNGKEGGSSAENKGGALNGIFHSNLRERLAGGKIKSHKKGDDLDVYCPAS